MTTITEADITEADVEAAAMAWPAPVGVQPGS